MSIIALRALVAFRGKGREKSRERGDIPVTSDGFDGSSFVTRFPFSFYVAPLIESMRKTTEYLEEQTLVSQFHTMGLEYGLGQPLSPTLIEAYLHDFTCMKTRPLLGVDRSMQATVLRNMLEMMVPSSHSRDAMALTEEDIGPVVEAEVGFSVPSGPTEKESLAGAVTDGSGGVNTLAALHHRFWRLERIADLYFELMNVFPDSVAKISQYVEEQRAAGGHMSELTHAGLVDLLLHIMEPWSDAWQQVKLAEPSQVSAFYTKWLYQVDYSRAHLNSLLDLISDEAIGTIIRMRLDRLGKSPQHLLCCPELTFL